MMNLVREYILIILPLIVLEFSLKGFCYWKLFKEGAANLNKALWGFIILINLIGPILFLTVGRRREMA